MRMELLKSGDSVGVGTNGSGGILLSVWQEDGTQARIKLTRRETEWLHEQLDEIVNNTKREIEAHAQAMEDAFGPHGQG
jgi:hypothetical protein